MEELAITRVLVNNSVFIDTALVTISGADTTVFIDSLALIDS